MIVTAMPHRVSMQRMVDPGVDDETHITMLFLFREPNSQIVTRLNPEMQFPVTNEASEVSAGRSLALAAV